MAKEESGFDQQWSKSGADHRTDFEKPSKGVGTAVGAVCLWVLGFALQAFGAIASFSGLDLGFLSSVWPLTLIVALVADVALTLAATKMWKKGAKKARKQGSGLLEVVVASAACVLMAVFFAVSKNATGKTKAASAAAALATVAALVAACLLL